MNIGVGSCRSHSWQRPVLEFPNRNVVAAEDAKADGAAAGGAEGETEGVDRSSRDDGASPKAVSDSPQDLQMTSPKAATTLEKACARIS